MLLVGLFFISLIIICLCRVWIGVDTIPDVQISLGQNIFIFALVSVALIETGRD